MSCAGFLQFIRRASVVYVALVALTAIYSTTAFAAGFDHTAENSVLPRVEAMKLSSPPVPCTNNADEAGKCCFILHCQIGIAVAPSVLATAPMRSLVGAETVDSGASLMPGRLDRPPKS